MTSQTSPQSNIPFMTCIRVGGSAEYTGILINSDLNVTSIYDYSTIRTDAERRQFLEFGDIWWWESNRKLPISIFLKQDMAGFRDYIKTFNSKDVEIVFGPTVNLGEIAEKRVKRKSIQLVRTSKKTK